VYERERDREREKERKEAGGKKGERDRKKDE